MGYYTNYELEIRSKSPITSDMMSQINKAFCELWLKKPFDQINWIDWFNSKPNEDDFKSPNFIQDNFLSEEQKWYTHIADMTDLSRCFPSIGFILYGEGEERGDNWMATFYNGQEEVSNGQITYEYNSLEDVMKHWRAN